MEAYKDTRERVTMLLASLAKDLGSQFELDENDICALQGKENLTLVIEAPRNDPQIYLYAPLVQLPPAGVETIYRQLLIMNCFTRRTSGTTLGLEPEDNVIILSYSELPEHLDSVSFPILLANFRQTALELQKELADMLKQLAEELLTPPSEDGAPQPVDGTDLPASKRFV